MGASKRSVVRCTLLLAGLLFFLTGSVSAAGVEAQAQRELSCDWTDCEKFEGMQWRICMMHCDPWLARKAEVGRERKEESGIADKKKTKKTVRAMECHSHCRNEQGEEWKQCMIACKWKLWTVEGEIKSGGRLVACSDCDEYQGRR